MVIFSANKKIGFQTRFVSQLFSLATCLLLLLPGSQTVLAEDQLALEEITVSARLRSEPVADVPLSMTVIDAEQVDALGVRLLSDLDDFIPNVQMSDDSRPVLTIRGRSNSARTVGVESGVGVYINGAYVSRGSINPDLFAVEQVEVLRGPQGTLYGKNNVTGAVRVELRKPQDEFNGQIVSSIGNYGRFDLGGWIEGGITDQLSARLALSSIQYDGHEKNDFSGSDRDGEDQVGAQLHLLFDPDSDWTLELFATTSEIERNTRLVRRLGSQDQGNQAINLATIQQLAQIPGSLPQGDPDKGSENLDPVVDRETSLVSLTLKKSIAEQFELTSISSWTDNKNFIRQSDEDFFPADLLAQSSRQNQQGFTQELRFTPAQQSGRLSWLAGAFYQDQELDSQATLTASDLGVAAQTGALEFYGVGITPGISRATNETRSTSIFGSIDYDFTNALTLSVGARYSDESKSASFEQQDGSSCITGATANAFPQTAQLVGLLQAGFLLPGFNTACLFPHYSIDDLSFKTSNFTPSLSLQYEFSESMVYYSVATGYRSGGFNVDFFRPATDAINAGPLAGLGLFAPGIRNSIPLALVFDDEEVVSHEVGYKTDALNNQLTLHLAAFYSEYENMQESVTQQQSNVVVNIAEAEIYGLEADFRWNLSPDWGITGGLGVIKAEYTDFPIVDTNGAIDNRRGQEFGPPRWDINLTSDYRFGLGANGDIATFVTVTKTHQRDELVNARVEWSNRNDSLGVSFWVDNAFDQRDVGTGVDSLFGLEYGIIRALYPPRQYGVDLSYSF